MWWIFNGSFITCLLLSLTVKEIWKSVNNCRSYGQFSTGLFFYETRCIWKIYAFVVSSDKFGFQKKLSCGHDLCSRRVITDYYTAGLSTVDTAFLDLSKAFDKVSNSILSFKLIKPNIPPEVSKLLTMWYRHGTAAVRRNEILLWYFVIDNRVR